MTSNPKSENGAEPSARVDEMMARAAKAANDAVYQHLSEGREVYGYQDGVRGVIAPVVCATSLSKTVHEFKLTTVERCKADRDHVVTYVGPAMSWEHFFNKVYMQRHTIYSSGLVETISGCTCVQRKSEVKSAWSCFRGDDRLHNLDEWLRFFWR